MNKASTERARAGTGAQPQGTNATQGAEGGKDAAQGARAASDVKQGGAAANGDRVGRVSTGSSRREIPRLGFPAIMTGTQTTPSGRISPGKLVQHVVVAMLPPIWGGEASGSPKSR